MKRINSHIAAAAYPVLDWQGELLRSRLRGREDADGNPIAALGPRDQP
jgi:hypothetical protein